MTEPNVAWLDAPEFDWHEGPLGHPERPARLAAIHRALEESGLLGQLHRLRAESISREWLLRVHDERYVERVESLSSSGGGELDADTYVKQQSFEAAIVAAGAVARAAQLVVDRRYRRAFCCVRPPGHHACYDRGMGFCLFNNVVYGALTALDNSHVQRVAILDWDVHHGNGTEDLTYERGDIFYTSIHQRSAFPGTGDEARRGKGAGAGANLNVPLPAGAGDEEMLSAWEEKVRPALSEYGPQLLLISAGFDADSRDPLAELRVTSSGFAELSSSVMRWADEFCEGRVVSTLEGGYALSALSEDVIAHVDTMLT